MAKRLYLGIVMALASLPGPVAAQTPTKTARACTQEYYVRKPALVGAQRRKRDFIALCRVTPIGLPTPIDDALPGSSADTYPPRTDYKQGFMFTPAYLSSPQVFDWLRHRPD